MRKILSFLISSVVLATQLIVPVSASSFSDVGSSDWFAPYVDQLAAAGVISTQNPAFYPNRTITRAELAKMAVRAAESQGIVNNFENPARATFCDVRSSDWAYMFVETLAAKHVVNGASADCPPENKIFLPYSPVSRAEALKILLGIYSISAAGSTTRFNDVNASMWYTGYIAKAVDMGLVNGYPDGSFRPNSFLTRAEMSKILTMLMRSRSPSPTPSTPTPSNINQEPQTNNTDLTYNIGSPTVQELWVSTSGNDDNNGSQTSPFASLAAALRTIPGNQQLTKGYKIHIAAGTYSADTMPNFLENKLGTAQAPIIVQGEGNVQINGNLNAYNVKYFYLINLKLTFEHDLLHFEKGDHILLKNLVLRNNGQTAQETLKVNQSQYVYVEDSDISGAWDNNIDFVAVQYGHVVRNKIHDAHDWCEYAKGGSAYLRIEGNEYYNCGNNGGSVGGFTAGQGAGFEFMTPPWIHYEAYDIRFVNNVIHDTTGAGIGVNGGYNILLANNTLYKVGAFDHAIEVVFGGQGCDGDTAACQSRVDQGGWGTAAHTDFPIGNKHVMIYNNIIYNPAPYKSKWTQFAIYAPRPVPSGSSAPNPAVADNDLQIKGNIIWNGPDQVDLGIGGEQGCQDNNPTCNKAQILRDNAINTLEPQLVNPSSGIFTLTANSNVKTAHAFALPTFNWNDAPSRPQLPAGSVVNIPFTKYRDGGSASSLHPGAY